MDTDSTVASDRILKTMSVALIVLVNLASLTTTVLPENLVVGVLINATQDVLEGRVILI